MAKQWHQLERLDHKSLKKLQVEREKAVKDAQSAAERKKQLTVVAVFLFVIVCAGIFLTILSRRSAQRAFEEARDKLYINTLTETTGQVYGRSLGDWERLEKGFVFTKEHVFKTEKEAYLTVELQMKNILKLAPESEMTVRQNTLAEKENRIAREQAELNRGEMTVAIALDGRDLLEVEAGGVLALGASGLYKILYDRTKNTGEIVVKNGLVEVFSKRQPSRKVKVSGFYKVTFANGEISNPTQASVIQYDWR
jgi:hypothetical protein